MGYLMGEKASACVNRTECNGTASPHLHQQNCRGESTAETLRQGFPCRIVPCLSDLILSHWLGCAEKLINAGDGV